MKSSSLRFATALALASAVACGGKSSSTSATTPDQPARPATVLDTLPPGTAMVFRLDVQHLVRSKLWTQLAAAQLTEGDTGQVITLLKEKCSLDPVADLTEVSVGVPASGEEDDVALVVRGRFDLAKLEKCAAAVAAAENEPAPVLTTTGKITELKNGDKLAYFGWAAPDTLVIVGGASDGDKTRLAYLEGNERASGDTRLIELWGHLKPDQLVSGAALLDGKVGDSMKMEGQPKPEAAWLNLAHHTGLKIELGLRYATADEAKASADKLTQEISGVSQQPPADKYFRHIAVKAQDREVHLVWELSEAELDQFVNEIGPMLPMILGAMSSG